MNKINPYIIEQLGLTDEQFRALEEKYSLIEPIVSEYTSPAEKRKLKLEAQLKLGIHERTLYTYLSDFRRRGISGLIRQNRSDKGKCRVFDPILIDKTLKLLKENPYRSMQMVMNLLAGDPTLRDKIKSINKGTLYHHLRKSGYKFKNGRGAGSQKVYHKFEAPYANYLWQSDARHGIPLPHPTKPGKTKMTYLFAWVDDFSRKILYAKYYFDEKLPSLEESFRQAVLRWGIPSKIYTDNGSAYISKQFTIATNAIGTRKIHHPPYQAWCKGKAESVMKRFLSFQHEIKLTGVSTIEELNETLWAWIEVEYNQKLHSSTGQTPNGRFADSLLKHPAKRVENLDKFNSCFLWQEKRVINKYGAISLNNNAYRIKEIGIGESVEVHYDPFNLEKIYIYYREKFHSTIKAYKLTNSIHNAMPEENKKSTTKISADSKRYFENIRKKHIENQNSESSFGFSNIIQKEKSHD